MVKKNVALIVLAICAVIMTALTVLGYVYGWLQFLDLRKWFKKSDKEEF